MSTRQLLAACPNCGRTLELSLSAADRRIACPACGRKFKVPNLEDLQKALSVADAAKGAIYVDENGNVYG